MRRFADAPGSRTLTRNGLWREPDKNAKELCEIFRPSLTVREIA
jgi:hypothetical protein